MNRLDFFKADEIFSGSSNCTYREEEVGVVGKRPRTQLLLLGLARKGERPVDVPETPATSHRLRCCSVEKYRGPLSHEHGEKIIIVSPIVIGAELSGDSLPAKPGAWCIADSSWRMSLNLNEPGSPCWFSC